MHNRASLCSLDVFPVSAVFVSQQSEAKILALPVSDYLLLCGRMQCWKYSLTLFSTSQLAVGNNHNLYTQAGSVCSFGVLIERLQRKLEAFICTSCLSARLCQCNKFYYLRHAASVRSFRFDDDISTFLCSVKRQAHRRTSLCGRSDLCLCTICRTHTQLLALTPTSNSCDTPLSRRCYAQTLLAVTEVSRAAQTALPLVVAVVYVG